LSVVFDIFLVVAGGVDTNNDTIDRLHQLNMQLFVANAMTLATSTFVSIQ
jgi:hypothetical protein